MTQPVQLQAAPPQLTLKALLLGIALAILLAGAFALPNMRTQFFPDVALRNINVNANWEGASAEDIDRGFIEAISPAWISSAL